MRDNLVSIVWHQSIVNMLFFVVLAFFCLFPFAHNAQANPKYASFVMDADTGLILHQRYANKTLHPASLTKVMTLLMVFEALESGKLRLNDRIYISHHAASMVPSKLGLSPGSSIRVKDAISALVTKSANDIAVAVAEHLAGSERSFAYLMTRRARDIGMKSTKFVNASGLHHKRQISTARDMAKMARYVIKRYPGYYRYFSQTEFRYRGKTYRSHNRLMASYKGMDGMKTGYVNASGFNLIASAVRNNRRVIGVVFGGKTSKSRNAHMAKLLDNAFGKLGSVRYASAKMPRMGGGIPAPGHKPKRDILVTHLNAVQPAASQAAIGAMPQKPTQFAHLKVAHGQAVPPPEVVGAELIGQGDFDEVLNRRVQTGLMTVAAHQGGLKAQKASLANDNWAIQIGAFHSKAQSAQALRQALKQLPHYYTQAKPQIMPLETANNRIYRARLSGYSSHDAYAACAYIKECITIAP